MAYKSKPATAAWIQRERKRLGLSTMHLAERLGTIGSKVSEQTISVWESNADRRPSAYNLDALERIFGSQAPDRDAGRGDTATIVAAIDRLTAAVEAQGRQQQEGMVTLASVLGEVMHALGGLPARTPGGSSAQETEAGR